MTTKINKLIESSANWGVCPFGFYTDEPEDLQRVPQSLRATKIFALSANRIKLRNYCLKVGIPSPVFIFSEKFETLSAWAIKRNVFPIIIKTEANHSNGDFCLVLKAFRELPEFYKKISAENKGNIMLEEFVQTKHLLEVTVINNQIRLVSQVAFEKSMLLRQASRTYPINVPAVVKKILLTNLSKFSELKTLKNIPCRFSFALRGQELMLLSLNVGMNRLEYHPRFSKVAGVDNIFESPDELKKQKICKIMNFFNVGQTSYEISELEAILHDCSHKYICDDKQTIIMIAFENTKRLLDKTKEIEAFFRHHSKSSYIQRN